MLKIIEKEYELVKKLRQNKADIYIYMVLVIMQKNIF